MLNISNFEKYAGKGAGATANEVEEHARSGLLWCLIHGATEDGWAAYWLLLIAGLGPNFMASSTWMFHHVLVDPTTIAKSIEWCGRHVDVCPWLELTTYELLRSRHVFSWRRYVHKGTVGTNAA